MQNVFERFSLGLKRFEYVDFSKRRIIITGQFFKHTLYWSDVRLVDATVIVVDVEVILCSPLDRSGPRATEPSKTKPST